ncbi:phage tail tape measure protein [Microbacterium sp. UCD-TDU]|uniref:phage tail tape measure protein n=1 Tax=Microbacterium sp. UCD-TDU TaxID=1247714 RepID=UPI00034D7F53|nr:phage tail tape measure protein [Microbacterium sp. UCD-TDU]EYT59449.1 hypothetical protein D514_0111645 [Microbacterium sp. UCD-TDU]
MALRAAEIESLFTADLSQIAKAEKTIKDTGERIEKKPIKVDADAKGALDGMDRVEEAAKRIVSKDTIATVDANIERGEKSLDRVQKRLDYLHSVETTMDVKADISRAEASLSKVSRNLDGLKAARATMEVDADTSSAEAELKQLPDKAKGAGDTAGKGFVGSLDAATRGAGEKVGSAVGDGVEETLIKALSAIPVAGGIVLAGVAIGKAITSGIEDGLNVEVQFDRLEALTGISETDALRLGRAAGEAYANVFGESIESNMDTTRLALQFRIIDPAATTRDAQLVIQGLSGIADVLGEEVQPVAAATASMLSSGVAKSSKEAFDILATGARNGVNRAEDLLDTFTEYPALFARLGLSGPEALGLINQGLAAGARNSDLAADALKEFQIRATDASEASAEGFKALGFDAEVMTAKIARGGQEARDGLQEVLQKLRETEDPVVRNAAAVALFGTQAEDLGSALFAMDLSTAVDQLNGVTGSAQKMFDTLAGNDATKIEQAQRNIEVAADGIKGALAGAFSEPLGDFADWVSQNRGPVLQFFSDLINGAIDFGISSTEAFGSFVSGPLAEAVEGIAGIVDFFNGAEGRPKELDDLAASMRDFDSTTDDAVKTLEGMRSEFNGFADGQIALGYVNDAALRTADAVSKVGLAVDGTRFSMDELDTSNLSATSSGQALLEQLDASASSLWSEYEAAIAAGESQDNLQARYEGTRAALMDQLTAMGLTQEQAQALIDTVLQTPDEASTYFSSNAPQEKAKVDELNQRVITLADGSVVVYADTAPAQGSLDRFITLNNGKRLMLYAGLNIEDPAGRYANGAIVEFMASGGIPGTTPMASLAQMVPPNTYRVVGDRSDVDELYAPLDGSARSWSLLMEGFRRMPGSPPLMGSGDVIGPSTSRTTPLADGQRVVLVVGEQEFNGYVTAQAGAVAAERGRQVASDIRGRRRRDS